MEFRSCHQPKAWLLDIGKVIVGVVGDVVSLHVERVVGGDPLHLKVKVAVGAETLALTCLGVVELTFAFF